MRELPDNRTITPETTALTSSNISQYPLRTITVKRKNEIKKINEENDRLVNAILNLKSEFSREQMDKAWWQKVLPVKRFMRMSRRPFKIEKVDSPKDTHLYNGTEH